ncbi:DUF2534 family protein [[Erwinia] mediterraneensis]|uniref:DUF2534 family protein n=1 Tax=[Erwinia] mediterraneensis TaxID=2161819 RepID=UPI00102FA6C9|nr:DUF2534 family protein [[Erwinia] mediterraneensis]
MSYSTTHASPGHHALFALLRRLHFYIGLFIAPFIFIAALTGTLYVLTPQIENALYADALAVEPQGAPKPLSEQIAAARAYVGETVKIYAVRPAPAPDETTRVQFFAADAGESESRALFIDPYRLQIKGDMTVYGTSGVLPLRMWIDKLHRGLLLGDAGRLYSELAASWLWVAALGGLVLWLGNRAQRQTNKSRHRIARTRHWHLTLGLILLGGLLFFSVTGLTWSQWAGNNINKLRAELGWLTPQVSVALDRSVLAEAPDAHADHRASQREAEPADTPMGRPLRIDNNSANGDWDRVLSAARAAGLGAAKIELRQPAKEGSAWTVTEIDRSWPSRVDAVSVNPHNFTIVDQVRFRDFPLVAKLTRWGVDAHMGILFGLPNQLLLAAFGAGLCILILLGYRLWWLRRPAAPDARSTQTLVANWLALPRRWKIISLVLAFALGASLPVMGASLLLFILFDLMRQEHQHKQATRLVAPLVKEKKQVTARSAIRQKEKRHFLTAVAVVALIAGSVMTRAIIGGALEAYAIPLSEWSLQLYVTHIMMIALYTTVFTALFSVPLWYFFLGEKAEPQQ